MAFQMGIIIGLSAFAGLKLDRWFETKVLFTLILSLSGVFAALYFFIKKALSDN
jgi:F0F1-type ATP synthase assembly protein I